MIQEFLGGVIKPDQKHKISTTSSISPAAAAPPESLRCPRCDSPNTKFCYYNNYNLTQPRHFCKTCRRYWTKGGALRNVPIGGGCRKNKSPSTVSTAAGRSPSGKLKTASSEFMKMGLFNGLEHAPDSAMAWTPSPTNYNFLSLLRDGRTPNYYLTNNNSNLTNSMPVKEKTNDTFLFGASPFSRATGPDSPVSARLPLSGRFPASLYGIGESPNSGLHELSQRLRSPPPTSCYYTGTETAPLILGNMTSANSSAAILESAPVGTSELGLWNASLSWPADLHTTNGVYP